MVGGVAVALNGFVRTTEDVDILIERSPENVARLLDALSGFGEGHARDLTAADFDEAEGAIRIIEDFPLDVFTVMRGKRYADLIHSIRRNANKRYRSAISQHEGTHFPQEEFETREGSNRRFRAARKQAHTSH